MPRLKLGNPADQTSEDTLSGGTLMRLQLGGSLGKCSLEMQHAIVFFLS